MQQFEVLLEQEARLSKINSSAGRNFNLVSEPLQSSETRMVRIMQSSLPTEEQRMSSNLHEGQDYFRNER